MCSPVDYILTNNVCVFDWIAENAIKVSNMIGSFGFVYVLYGWVEYMRNFQLLRIPTLCDCMQVSREETLLLKKKKKLNVHDFMCGR